MTKKQKENYQNLSLNDLQKKLIETKNKLIELKFELNAGKVKNIREIRRLKKEVARILTAINIKNKQK
jgi:large subunit ribosomal protein L29